MHLYGFLKQRIFFKLFYNFYYIRCFPIENFLKSMYFRKYVFARKISKIYVLLIFKTTYLFRIFFHGLSFFWEVLGFLFWYLRCLCYRKHLRRTKVNRIFSCLGVVLPVNNFILYNYFLKPKSFCI